MTQEFDIEQLFRSNYRAMLSLARRIVHDADTAEDIVHDIFASLLTDCPPRVTPAYLLRGVRFACLNHIRNLAVRDRLNKLYTLDTGSIADEEWPDPEDIALLNEIVDSRLSAQCRRVMRLRFTSRLTYREIAEETGMSEVAVYKYLRQALNILRENFTHNER